MESGLGGAPALTSALSESGIGCVALAVPEEGQGPPEVTHFIPGQFPEWMSTRWLPQHCRPLDETGDLSLRWTK